MKKIRTHYDNLKVSRDAPTEVIRSAYKALSIKYHPDKNQNKAESERIMKILNESYSVLSDPKRRAEHDAWIDGSSVTSSASSKYSETTTRSASPKPLRAGKYHFSELDKNILLALTARVSGKSPGQLAIKMEGVIWNYIWLCILLCWFAFLIVVTEGLRWDQETVYFYAGFTAIVALLLGRNFSFIYHWNSTPFKSFLIFTPLYVIRARLDTVSYWPLTSLSDIKAVHNYRNGAFENTSLTLFFDGTPFNFSLPKEKSYNEIVRKIAEYDKRIREAIANRDVNYFIDNNDFVSQTNAPARKNSAFSRNIRTLKSYSFSALVSGIIFFVAYSINSDYSPRPVYSSTNSTSSIPNRSASVATFARPPVAPNGSSWPSQFGYIDGYDRLNTDGLSSVTVDNTRNDADVYVKLFYLDLIEPNEVRNFYIAAGNTFTLKNVRAGNYDIRYRDLVSGQLSRSESFSLEEIRTVGGTQYSELTMTLYKVSNGNMQTYQIQESEF